MFSIFLTLPNVLFSRRASGVASEPLPDITNIGISRRVPSERKRGRLELGLAGTCQITLTHSLLGQKHRQLFVDLY
jgi:hypothetical protein